MVGGRERVVHLEYFADLYEEFRRALETFVGDKIDWRAVREDLVVQELLRELCFCESTKRDGGDHLFEAALDHYSVTVSTSGRHELY